MEDRKSFLLFDMCRLCLQNLAFTYIGMDLRKDILWCTGVNVAPSENLPIKICFECLDVISNAKKLKEAARKNDKHLRSLFGQSEEPKEQISETSENVISRLNVDITVKSKFFSEDHLAKNGDTQKSDSTDHHPAEDRKIIVRKDLFDSPSVSSSPTTKSEEKSQTDDGTKFTMVKLGREGYGYKCKVCSKIFDTWKKYYLHQRFHNKNITCPIDNCGKKFAVKGDLDKHIRTHTGEKPYRCSLCSKQYSQRGSLKSHIEAVHPSSEMKCD